MMKRTLIAILAAAALSPALMAADEWKQPLSEKVQSGAAKAVDSDISDAISANPDRAFAAVVISHARLQRQISDYVAEKATNPQIKKYAQELSTEYDQFSQQVKEAAKKEGITLQQDRMLPRDQAVLDFIKQLPVNSLERNYVFHQAGTTQTQLLMCQWVAKNGQKESIKQAAQEMQSKLQARQETAQKLAMSEIGNGARMATEEK